MKKGFNKMFDTENRQRTNSLHSNFVPITSIILENVNDASCNSHVFMFNTCWQLYGLHLPKSVHVTVTEEFPEISK